MPSTSRRSIIYSNPLITTGSPRASIVLDEPLCCIGRKATTVFSMNG